MNAPPEIVYRDSANAGAVLFLRPAQLWFGSSIDGVRRICTVLGSCVALTCGIGACATAACVTSSFHDAKGDTRSSTDASVMRQSN